MSKEWKKFVNDNKDLICSISLPLEYIENQQLFEYFLMHGCTDDSDRPGYQSEVPEDEQDLIRELIFSYFRSGFGDPGICVIPGVISNEDVEQLTKRV